MKPAIKSHWIHLQTDVFSEIRGAKAGNLQPLRPHEPPAWPSPSPPPPCNDGLLLRVSEISNQSVIKDKQWGKHCSPLDCRRPSALSSHQGSGSSACSLSPGLNQARCLQEITIIQGEQKNISERLSAFYHSSHIPARLLLSGQKPANRSSFQKQRRCRLAVVWRFGWGNIR